jgi:hypothetical protein
VQDANITDGNAFSDEVKVDLDMLCTLVLNEVGEEVDSADIIAVDKSALRQQSMELLEELPEPTGFSHAIGNNVILNLRPRAGHDVLALGGTWDEVVAEEHNITWGGPACIRTTHPICICVDHQLRGAGEASQVEVEVQGASQIAQEALYRDEVRLPGIMHVKEDLLDDVGDVVVGERQVLEGPGEAPDLSQISNRRP